MKKLLFLFILCTSLSVFATAQDYEDIAECVLSVGSDLVPRLTVLNGDYCYGIHRFNNCIEVFDVSDVFNLTTFTTKSSISTVYPSSTGYSVAKSGNYMYTTGSAGGSVLDISSAAAPVEVGTFNTMFRCVNMVVSGNYLVGVEYTSNTAQANAVEVWDISTPTAPVSVSHVLLDQEGWSVAVYGDYIYAASDWSVPLLSIIDFSDPKNISLLNTMPLNEIPYHLKIVDNKLVTSSTSIARLFDLTDPVNPVELDAEAVTGRVCATDNLNVITNGQVHKVSGSNLDFVQTFDTHGSSQSDGFPFASDVMYVGSDGMIALTQQSRVLILRTIVPPEPLTVDINQISEATGGIANFKLDAQPANAGRNYIILGSVTGTSPGTPLPGGLVTLPLNWDLFTSVVISFINTPIFSNFLSVLDANGQAAAVFDTLGPIPGTAGITMNFAFAIGPPPAWDFASNAVEIKIVP